MSDVFISYSCRDIDFVRHLFDQLTPEVENPGPIDKVFLMTDNMTGKLI